MSKEESQQEVHFEDEEMEQMPPSMRPPTTRPPHFEILMNGIRGLTKKVDHVTGFKFDLGGSISNNMHITGSWGLPNPALPKKNPFGMPPAANNGDFQLGIQYLHGPVSQIQQPKVIMTGRLDSGGKLEAVIMKKLNNTMNLRLNAGYMNSDVNYAQVSLDLNIDGDDYCHSVKLGNQVSSFSMMQSIGKKTALGFELMHLRNMFLFNYGGKYRLSNSQNFLFQYMAPNQSLVLAFQNNIKKRTQLVAELEYGVQDGKTKSVLGYRQTFNSSNLAITLNSKGKITSSFNLLGFAHQLKLCAQANYLKDSYKFGYGISMGQVQ